MEKMEETTAAALQFLETLPLVMRGLGSRLRKKEGMPSSAHFGILFMLANGNMNLSEMARVHNVSMPTMSNSVTTLVQHGLVRRRRAAHDRRQVVVELTGEGLKILNNVQDEAVAYVRNYLEGLSPEEIGQLRDGLSVLKKAFLEPQAKEVENF